MLLYREEAFCTAVTNAKKKAESVSQTVGLCLGSVVTLAEVHQSEEADHCSSQGSLIEERRREGRGKRAGRHVFIDALGNLPRGSGFVPARVFCLHFTLPSSEHVLALLFSRSNLAW